MGIYINKGYEGFQSVIYIDMTRFTSDIDGNKIVNYTGDIVLASINYDKGTKRHECMIEEFSKHSGHL